MRKEHSHEYYWVLIFAAALGMYLLRVLLIAGEGKEELEMPVGRFFVDVTFSEEGEFLPPSYLEAARDPEFCRYYKITALNDLAAVLGK